MEPFVYHAPTRVVAGEGSIERLAQEVAGYGRECLVGELLGDATDAPGAIRRFIQSLGVTPCLGAYGMRDTDVEPFTHLAKDKKNIQNSPGEWPVEVLQDLYRRSL